MNKTIKFLTTLLLLAVSVGAWAEQLEFDFEDETAHRNSGNNSYSSTPNTYTENGVNISLTYADAVTSGSPLVGNANVMGRIAKNTTNSPVVLIGPINNYGNKITTIYYTIKGVSAMKIVAEYSTDNSTWNTLQTISSMPTTKTIKTISNLNITAETVYLRFTVSVTTSTTSSRDFQLDDVILNYEPTGSSDLTASDLALTNAPVALNFDLYNNISAQTISYTTSSTGAVTVSGGDGYVTTSVDATNKTITVTPTAVTPSAQTITVNQAADDTYAAGSATFTVTITDSTPGFTVTLNDDNSTLTETSVGAGVTLPSRDALNGYDFAGWSETNVETETTTAPTIIPVGTYHPTDNITLYPVYTRTEGGSAAQNNTASVTIADYASANGWENGMAYQPLTMDDNISVGGTVSGNNFKYYSSDSSWRFYTDGSFTISASNGATLSSVTLTFNGGTLKYGDTSITSGTAFNVSGNTAKISCTANAKVTAISVTYTIPATGTTYYWSSPIAAAVERPVIDVPETFTFSTTATITCATEGASIKYSFDNENWSDYTESLTITETKTIYAKGVKGTDESEVVSKTTTKQQVTPTVTINATGITNTNVYEGTDAGTLAATVAYDDNAIADAIVTWSGNNNEVATIDAETGIVTLVAAGTVTFTATYAGNSDYAQATATYEMTVTNTDPNAPGTQNNPYTVAQAIAYIQTLGSSTSPSDVYVHGIISQVDSYNDRYHSITYWISDDGTTSTQMQVYSGKGLNGADFSSMDDLMEGDIVTVKGFVKTYEGTPEFDKNNQLVSHRRPTNTDSTITLDPSTINVDAEEHEGTIAISLENLTVEDKSEFVVQYWNGNEPVEEIDWVTVEVAEQDPQVGEGFVVSYTVAANEGPTRNAAFKLYVDGDEETVWSDLVTITQAAAPGIVDNYELFTGNLVEGDYLIVYDGKAMNTTVTSDRLQYAEVTATNDVITTDNAAIVWHIAPSGNYWTIYNADANAYAASTGAKNKAQMLADGTDDKALWTVFGTETYDFTNKENNESGVNATLRNNGSYGFACYATSTGGELSLFKKVEATPTQAVSISDAGMATFCSDKALDFTAVDAIHAYYVNVDNNGNLTFTRIRKIPANTGVLLRNAQGEDQGAVAAINVPVLSGEAESVEGNAFVAVLEEIAHLASNANGFNNYILNKKDGRLGFYHANNQKVGAGKAYLRIDESIQARDFFGFNEGEATGIENVNHETTTNGRCYNLNGQQVSANYKGIVIVNGKKTIVK